MLPEGWNKRSVAEVCRSVSVGVVIKPSQYYVSAREGVKAFRSANVKEGQINNSDWVYFSHKGHNENKKSELKSGDVLVVRTGYPGTACVVSPEYAGCNAIDIVIARPDIQKIIPTYLCLFTNSEYGKSQVANLQGGMAQKHLNVGAYQQVEIPLPSLPEQKKIAAILSTWDRAIEGTEKLLANSQQQKKALMQQLLTGKKRLPGFSGEWAIKTFSDLFTLKIGGTPARSNVAYWDIDKATKNRWVAISDLKNSKIRSTSEHISDLGAQKSNCSLISKGTIILSFKLTIGKKAILLEDCYTNEAICALIIKDKKTTYTDYIYQSLDNVNYEEEIDQAVKGKTLNKEKLARLRMSFPPFPEQKAIAAVLTTADEEITAIESDLSRLRQEKKALMQQLLTGKRRVRVN
ncbi:restriction endonuclease subunit S [Komagataeibacter sp. FXV2]|nr:restriction endonuclease subunit S [Komagataeibacter sp. FXV2]